MKKLIVLMLATFFTLFSAVAISAQQQNKLLGEEYHHAVSVYHKDAVEHAKALYWLARTFPTWPEATQDVAAEHVEDINRDLGRMKRRYGQALTSLTEEEKKPFGMYDKAVREHYKQATVYAQALSDEVAKDTPDPKRIMDLAAGVYQQLEAAEEAHIDIRAKRGVRDYIPEYVQEIRNRPIREGK